MEASNWYSVAHLEDESSNSALLAEGLGLYGIQGLMCLPKLIYTTWYNYLLFCAIVQVP